VLPLVSPDEFGISDDLDGGRLERLVELAETQGLAIGQKAMKFCGRVCLGRDLVDVVVESLWVLDARRDGVVPVMELGEEILPFHAKLPSRPLRAEVVVVHVPIKVRNALLQSGGPRKPGIYACCEGKTTKGEYVSTRGECCTRSDGCIWNRVVSRSLRSHGTTKTCFYCFGVLLGGTDMDMVWCRSRCCCWMSKSIY